MSKLLITGATGHLGKLVVELLAKKQPVSSIAVLVRDSEKAKEFTAKGIEARIGDFNDYASLVTAFRGIDKLYFVSSNDIANREKQHENVVNAAKEAGVGHVIYTSFARKNETETSPITFVAKSHLHTEKLLKASGVSYTILKHALYTDIIPMFIGDKVLETGVIFQPAGEGKSSFVTRQDFAELAVAVLTTPGHENKEYEAVNTEAVSYQDVADILTEITGKKISYVAPTAEVFTAELTKAGVPGEVVGLLTGFNQGIAQGEFADTDATLERLIGRRPTSVKAYLQQVYESN